MTKKAFVVILVLTLVITYSSAIIDALVRNSLLGGSAGLPFKFASGYFGASNTNYLALFADTFFWFIVIWGIWKLAAKKSKKTN